MYARQLRLTFAYYDVNLIFELPRGFNNFIKDPIILGHYLK